MGLYGNDVYLWIIENNGMKNTYPPYIIVVGEYLRRIKKMIRFLFLGSFPIQYLAAHGFSYSSCSTTYILRLL